MNDIGESRFRIELIENFPYEDIYQLIQREGHCIRELGTLKMKIAERTDQEYYQDNKSGINEKHKEYKRKNQDKIKQNNNDRKEDMKQYHKNYREKKMNL